jgi:hypothetical protein
VNVLIVSGQFLDWKYIRRWTDEHQTTELLEKLRLEAEEQTIVSLLVAALVYNESRQSWDDSN